MLDGGYCCTGSSTIRRDEKEGVATVRVRKELQIIKLDEGEA